MSQTRVLRSLVTMAAAAVVASGLWSASPAQAAEAVASPGDESAFVQAINSLRAQRGLGSLRIDGELSAIARSWSFSMADAGAISHRPSLSAGVTSDWTALGENVGEGPSVADLMNAFVNSPGHYKNLVDARFTHIGIGAVTVDGFIYTAHEFMAVATAASAPAPAPAPTVRSRSSAPRPTTTAAPRRIAARTPAPAPVAPARLVVELPPTPPVPVPSGRILEVLDRTRGNPPTL